MLSYAVAAAITVDEIGFEFFQSPWSASARTLLRRIHKVLHNFSANGLIDILLAGVTRVVKRRHDICKSLPLLTSDCWPTGTSPRIDYESVA